MQRLQHHRRQTRLLCQSTGQVQGGGLGSIVEPQLIAEGGKEVLLGVGILQLLGHPCGGQILPFIQLLHHPPQGRHRLPGVLHALLGSVGHVVQTAQQQGIVAAALAVVDHFNGLLVGKSLLVAALAGQGIIGVRQRHHLCGDGDVIPGQSVGIPLAVPALMVPPADLNGVLHQLLVAVHGQLRQDLRPQLGVGLDDGELLVRQLAGLLQDILRHQQFPDIVQARRCADEVHILRGQGVLRRHRHQPPQQKPCQVLHAGHMAAALAVAVFHGEVQDGQHHLAALLLPVDPAGEDVHHLLPPGVEQDGVDDALPHHRGGEGAVDVVHRPQLKGPVDVAAARLGGDHHRRHVLQPLALLHLLQHLKPVHLRHNDVQQQGRQVLAIDLQCGEGLLAVGDLHDLEILLQHIGQNGPVHLRIVCDQQLFSFHSILLRVRRPKGRVSVKHSAHYTPQCLEKAMVSSRK